MADHVRALRSIDANEPAWRNLLIAAVQLGSRDSGRLGQVSDRRARSIADEVLKVIREHGEDLEGLIEEIKANTERTRRRTEELVARRTRFEHTLGLVDVVPGEVVRAHPALE